MSTFLQLAQDAARECGASNTGPSAVTSQTGELNRFVKWTAQSYTEIQASRPNWRWLRSEFTVDTVADDDDYLYSDCTDSIDSAAITRFARWLPQTMQIYLTSAGSGTQHYLIDMEWDDFKQLYKSGSQTSGYPSFVSFDPRNHLRLGAAPDAVYTVTGDYQKSPQVLAADDDEPEMPSQFHQLIVYGAMEKYAGFEGAAEVWTRVKNEAKYLRLALEQDQLPRIGFGPPLA